MITRIVTNWLGRPGGIVTVTIFLLECNSMFDLPLAKDCKLEKSLYTQYCIPEHAVWSPTGS